MFVVPPRPPTRWPPPPIPTAEKAAPAGATADRDQEGAEVKVKTEAM